MEMYNADDVAKICGCSKSKAGNMIRALNKLFMETKGFSKALVIAGKISKKFFHKTLDI